MRGVRVIFGAKVGGYRPGDVVELPDEQAARYVGAGKATVLPDPAEPETVPEAEAPAGDTAPDAPPEPGTAGDGGADGDSTPGDGAQNDEDEPSAAQAKPKARPAKRAARKRPASR